MVTCLRQWKNKLVEAGFQELVFEDAMEVVIDQLNSLGTAEPLQTAMLEENMRRASHARWRSLPAASHASGLIREMMCPCCRCACTCLQARLCVIVICVV